MKRKLIIKILLLCLAGGFLLPPRAAWGAKKAEAQEYLTKGEAIMLLSATDFMKKKIGELLSWTIGYDVSKVNRVRLTPTINYVKVIPKRIPPDGRTILEVETSVDDPGGLMNIAGVRADLSSIGRLPNTMLVDSGLFGDDKAGDGIYSLQTTVAPTTSLGGKDIPVAVANKKGWLALAKTTLDIRKNPVIIEAKVAPERVSLNNLVPLTVFVKIDNPGRLEDVSAVTLDLRAVGLKEKVNLKNDGQAGDLLAADNIWSLQFNLPKGLASGTFVVPVEVVNLAGGATQSYISLAVTQ